MPAILIVSHDAGGAEILSSWVKYHPSNQYRFILEGPAVKIFREKIPFNIDNFPRTEFPKLINACDFILTATSGEADLERLAIKISKQYKKKIISHLDHWCEYAERFDDILPDEIWVADEHAYTIAEKSFPRTPITLIKNYYLTDFKISLQLHKVDRMESGLNLLYICEPIADYAAQKYKNVNYFGYTEYDALIYFFSVLSNGSYNDQIHKIRLRLHPLEEQTKYQNILRDVSFDVETSTENLIQDLLWADWVVGCSSMALVQAMFAERKVFTCNPPGANVFKFPHFEIKPLETTYKQEL